jgi:gamma-butyrobetaine dioxygenase
MVDPPQVQILHSLQADAPGGSSILSDGLFAAHELLEKHPDYFEILTKWKVCYGYFKSELGQYRNSHTTFKFLPQEKELETRDRLSLLEGIYYSPPFQISHQPQIQTDPDTGRAIYFGDYLEAIRAFASITEDQSRSIYERRLEPGEAIIFDNRRILHSRTAFDATKGIRWLKGGYVDSDGFRARLRSVGLLGSLDQAVPSVTR